MAVCTDKRTFIESQITAIDTQLTAANTAYLAALGTEVEDYTFDSAEARQKAKIRSPDEIQKQINNLIARRNHLCGRLNGTNLTIMNLRRK